MGCSPEGQGRLCLQGCIPTPSCDLISPAVARGGAVMGQKPKALLVPVVLPWAGFMVSFHLAFRSPLALSSVQGKVSQPCLHGHPVKVHSPAISLLLGVCLCRFPAFAPGLSQPLIPAPLPGQVSGPFQEGWKAGGGCDPQQQWAGPLFPTPPSSTVPSELLFPSQHLPTGHTDLLFL